MENFYHPLAEAERGLPAQASRGTVRAFASNDLKKAVVFRSTDEIPTEAFHSALPAQYVSNPRANKMGETQLLLPRVTQGLRTLRPLTAIEKGNVTAFAAKQLIDIFLLERLIGKMSSPRLFEKEHSSMVLDSLMLDILLQQFFSVRRCQRATFENVPLRDFHLRAFTKVALDVILTELNKLAVEDMEDLLEHERGVQEQEPEAFPEASESRINGRGPLNI